MNKIIKHSLPKLLFFITIGLSGQDFKNDNLTITKASDNLWIIKQTNNAASKMFLIEGQKKALLFDTGLKYEKLDSIIKLITKKPLYVVISHMHFDHIGNINQFNTIYAHTADTVVLSLFEKVTPYKGEIKNVSDGYIFDLGGTKLEVAFMAGHTPGSIILLDRKSGNSFTGDAFGSGFVYLQGPKAVVAPIQTYINSCIRMEGFMNKGINKIYPGHGEKIFEKNYITDMRLLAEDFKNGNTEGVPFPIKVGCPNPQSIRRGKAVIVYNPEAMDIYLSK